VRDRAAYRDGQHHVDEKAPGHPCFGERIRTNTQKPERHHQGASIGDVQRELGAGYIAIRNELAAAGHAHVKRLPSKPRC
jgi:hypothetical protein